MPVAALLWFVKVEYNLQKLQNQNFKKLFFVVERSENGVFCWKNQLKNVFKGSGFSP